MPTIITKKKDSADITLVKKIRDYSTDAVFKKKAEEDAAALKKSGLPKNFKKQK